jgi:hypothetical protein
MWPRHLRRSVKAPQRTRQEAVMNRTQLFARCAAAAATATLIAGLAATPATARPDPGEPASQQIQADGGRTKAQIEHDEQLSLYGRHNKAQTEHDEQLSLYGRHNKAQTEHDEQLALRSTGDDDIVAAPAEFPWAMASLAAAGLAAAATGGVVVLRQRRTALLSASTGA